MKQKVVIKVTLNGQKSRSKALKIAVGFSGQDKSQIEVVGDGVDVAKLTILLKKKMGYADLVSVSAVGGEKKEEKKKSQKCSLLFGPCMVMARLTPTSITHPTIIRTLLAPSCNYHTG
ncbi:unnamed protein product [Dovyalis caffra]|uniref:Uncharacterized protein n=1 Tax=Dovyalis caffra TaxID=77055 RepID=A0AAV1SD20_9ROSI|nr:unnamed protein product [Dovyalis caffra]